MKKNYFTRMITITMIMTIAIGLGACTPTEDNATTADEVATTTVTVCSTAATEPATTVPETTAATEPTTVAPTTTAPEPTTPPANKPTTSGSNSTSKPKPQSKPETPKPQNKPQSNPPVVTDDTVIPHSELCTDVNMNKVTSAVNSYFQNLGMRYTPENNINSSGWYLVQTNLTTYYDCSVNTFKNNTIEAFLSDTNATIAMVKESSGITVKYSDIKFNCYAARQSDGEYDIYFCYN